MNKNKALRAGVPPCLFATVMAAALVGCGGNAATRHDPRDPYEGWNRGVQSFNDKLDDYFMKPLAKGYQYVTPSFVDKGVSNFFSNVDDIAVTLNDFLQGKLDQGTDDASRFLINTSVGVGGLIDVASSDVLKDNLGVEFPKHNEDFDQTLGTWGLSTGPYLVLPFVGPSSPRGLTGLLGDTATNPFTYVGGTAVSSGVYGLRTVDTRADLLTSTKIMDEAAVDRYEFIRNAYLQQRNYLVYDGHPPYREGFEDDLDKEMEENLAPNEK